MTVRDRTVMYQYIANQQCISGGMVSEFNVSINQAVNPYS